MMHLSNTDTQCLVKSIIIYLGKNNKNKLGDIFKNKLTDAEVAEINYKRKDKTGFNNGIFTDNEITYLRQPTKNLWPLLADAFHRIYDIERKPQGNDIVDAKSIPDKIDVQINVYSCDRKILCTTAAATAAAKSITVHLLLDNNHFDPIVKISAFSVKEEITRCKFCNANGECIENIDKIICSACNKSYFNHDCYANHVINNRCINHTYKCDKCYKIIRHRERPKAVHKCGEYYCGCCQRFVEKPHQCCMQRKFLNTPSDIGLNFLIKLKLWCMRVFQASSVIEILIHVKKDEISLLA
jgi:hypothetical protein